MVQSKMVYIQSVNGLKFVELEEAQEFLRRKLRIGKNVYGHIPPDIIEIVMYDETIYAVTPRNNIYEWKPSFDKFRKNGMSLEDLINGFKNYQNQNMVE